MNEPTTIDWKPVFDGSYTVAYLGEVLRKIVRYLALESYGIHLERQAAEANEFLERFEAIWVGSTLDDSGEIVGVALDMIGGGLIGLTHALEREITGYWLQYTLDCRPIACVVNAFGFQVLVVSVDGNPGDALRAMVEYFDQDDGGEDSLTGVAAAGAVLISVAFDPQVADSENTVRVFDPSLLPLARELGLLDMASRELDS